VPVSRRGLILFLTLGIVWGLPYLLIKIAVEDLSVPMVVFGRLFFAAIILMPIVIARRQLGALRGHMRWVLAFAFVEMTITWWCLTYAETRLTSSLTGLLIATVPLVAAVMAKVAGLDDRLTGRRLVGLGIGFLGVVAIVGLDISGAQWLAVLALAITAFGYALGPIIVDLRLSQVPSLPVIAVAITANAVVYAPFAWLQRPTAPVPVGTWVAVIALGLVCTALAFILFFALIAEVGPARTTLITYINPAVAVILGTIVLAEPVTWGLVIGFPLVLIGSWLATRRAPARALAVEAEPHP
jgi:drug/metabolite transporter (DMT)-like permease